MLVDSRRESALFLCLLRLFVWLTHSPTRSSLALGLSSAHIAHLVACVIRFEAALRLKNAIYRSGRVGEDKPWRGGTLAGIFG